jgi:hypothetical protein
MGVAMPKHAIDPVFRELVSSINESGQAVVPVVVTVHGVVLRGSLISEARYFTELAERTPLMSALQPASGLLGKEYAKGVEAASGYYLHLRATRLAPDGDEEGLWRVRVADVGAWSLPAAGGSGRGSANGSGHGSAAAAEEKGPFARLVSG